MKKTMILTVLLLTMSAVAKAQINFGVKGGLNVTDLSLNKNVISSSNQMGFFIGPTIRFTLPIVGLGIDAAALYDERSSELIYDERFSNMDGADQKIKEQSLQIPINLRYGIGLSSLASIYFFAGPQFGFSLGSKVTEIIDNGAEWRLDSSNLSGNIGAGLILMKHLQASVNYNFALGKTGEFEVLDAAGSALGFNGTKIDGKMNAWQLSVTYYF